MKQRKPRTKSKDFDYEMGACFGFPGEETPAIKKFRHRLKLRLCLGCGKEVCECKS